MTTRAQLSAAPTSSTARNTNAIKVSVSMVVVWLCGMGMSSRVHDPGSGRRGRCPDDPASATLAASGSHPSRFLHCMMVVGRETELRRVAELLAGARLRRGGALLVTGEAGVGKSTLLDEVATMAAGARSCAWWAPRPSRRCRTPRSASCSATSPTSSTSCRLPQARALGRGPGPARRRPAAGLRGRRRDAGGADPAGRARRRSSCCSTTPTCSTSRRRGRSPSRRAGWAPTRCSSWPPQRSGEGGPLAEAGLPELAVTGSTPRGVGSLMADARAAGDAPRPRPGRAPSRRATRWPSPSSSGGPTRWRGWRSTTRSRCRAGWSRCSPSGPASLGADVQLVVALTALAGGSAALVVDAALRSGLDDAALGRAEAGRARRPRRRPRGSPAPAGRVGGLLQPQRGAAPPAPRRRRRGPAPGAHRRARPAPRRRRGRSRRGAGCRARAGRGGRRRRGAPAVAAAGLERAAGITPDAGRRTDRLLAAAEAAWAAGDAAWATRLCDEVVRAAGAGRPVARRGPGRQHRRPRRLARRRRRSLLGAAEPAGAQDPEAASRIVAEAVTLAFNLADAGVAAAAGPGTRPRCSAGELSAAARGRCLMTTGIAAVFGGGSGEAELRAALTQLRMPAAHPPPDGQPRDATRDDDEDAVWALIVMLYLRGSEAVDELSREIDSRRASWAVGTLPRLLFLLARADATRDRWVRGAVGLRRVDRAGPRARAGHRAGDVAGRARLARGPHRCRRPAPENAAASLALADPEVERHRRGVGRVRPR